MPPGSGSSRDSRYGWYGLSTRYAVDFSYLYTLVLTVLTKREYKREKRKWFSQASAPDQKYPFGRHLVGTPSMLGFHTNKSKAYPVPTTEKPPPVHLDFSANSPCGQPFPSAHGTSGFASVVAAPALSACKPLSSAINQSGYPYSGSAQRAQQPRKFTHIASILFRGRRSNSKLERTPHG